MTVKHAIDSTYNQVISLGLVVDGIYRYSKPVDKKDDVYIVINSLPVNNGILQKCFINVNVHVKDMNGKEGYADSNKLDYLSGIIADHFTDDVIDGNIIMQFKEQNTLPESELKSHYSNIRVKVFMLNS